MLGRILIFLALMLATARLPVGQAAEAAGKSAPPPKPALPPIRSLKVEPASLTLEDGRDERRVLVWGETVSGQRFDLTDEAAFKAESPEIEIDNTGYFRPQKQGNAEVSVSVAGLRAKLPV